VHRPLAIAALAAGLAASAAASAAPASGQPAKASGQPASGPSGQPASPASAETASPASAEAASPPPDVSPAPTPPPAPPAPRLIDVPSGAIQPRGGAFAAAGGSHRGDAYATAVVGLGGIAEVGIGLDDRISGGSPATELTLPVASFRVGVAADRLFRGQPDVALGFVRNIGDRAFAGFDVGADPGPVAGGAAEPAPDHLDVAELHLAATRRLAGPTIGNLALTAGAALWDAAATPEAAGAPDAPVRLGARGLGAALRPFAGLAWNPGIYPRTTLLVDAGFAPVVTADDPRLAWRLAWGVRYQALSWGSIELAVRHRADEGLRGSTVLVRLAAAFR
jgi:hypothetical protein